MSLNDKIIQILELYSDEGEEARMFLANKIMKTIEEEKG